MHKGLCFVHIFNTGQSLNFSSSFLHSSISALMESFIRLLHNFITNGFDPSASIWRSCTTQSLAQFLRCLSERERRRGLGNGRRKLAVLQLFEKVQVELLIVNKLVILD